MCDTRVCEDLLVHVGRERPDVVVLAGPFVDTHHPTVARGACALESDDGDAEEVVNGVPRIH